MGADGQPQIHAQTYVHMIDHGMDIQTSLGRRRAGSPGALRSAVADKRYVVRYGVLLPLSSFTASATTRFAVALIVR